MSKVKRGARTKSKPAANAKTAQEPPRPESQTAARAWFLAQMRQRKLDAHGEDVPQTGRGWSVGVMLGAVALALWLGGFAEHSLKAANRYVERAARETGFEVRHIEVRGLSRADAEEVRRRLMIEPGENIFAFDPKQARRRVEATPWVEEAAVKRLLPNRVIVMVRERRALAIWRHEGRDVVIDTDGTPIDQVSAAQFTTLPVVAGESAPEAAAALVDALDAAPDIARRAVLFRRIGARRWDMVTFNGVTVRLGEESPARSFERLTELHVQSGVLDQPLSLLDMRGGVLVMRGRDGSRERGA